MTLIRKELPEPEMVYPNKWREQVNLSKISVQITNKNRFNPEDIINPNIKNNKYLDLVKKLLRPEFVFKSLKWLDDIDEENKRVS